MKRYINLQRYNNILITHERQSFNKDILYSKIEYLNSIYPDFKDWYYNKVIPGLESGDRIIITDQTYSTVVILKVSEGKICTFINKHPKIFSIELFSMITKLISELSRYYVTYISITIPYNKYVSYYRLLKHDKYRRSGDIIYKINGKERYDYTYIKQIN